MPKPARILYVHNSTLIGGGNRVLLGLLEKLDRRLFEPWSLIPADGPMRAALKERDVPCLIEDVLTCVTAGSLVARAAVAARLALKLRRQRFRLLHAQSPLSYKIPSLALQKSSTRRLCHFHFPPEGDFKSGLQWQLRIEPHGLVACSEGVAAGYRATVEELWPEAPLRVLINFADTERFAPGPPPPAFVRELRLDEASHVVTICGQVSERKGHPDFLRMAKLLLARFPAAKFLIAGEDILTHGEYQRKMEQLGAELGLADSVCFLGFREDVPGVLRASDVVVLPSSAEGMPLSLIEAAACGKPVVSYDIPGVDEVVVQGETGKLVRTGDVEALATAVTEVLADRDSRVRMGACARSRAEEKFSLGAYVKATASLYEEILATVRVP